jgi:hypothetical protein
MPTFRKTVPSSQAGRRVLQSVPKIRHINFIRRRITQKKAYNSPKVHYRIHKCPPPVPILNHLDLVHTPHPTSRRSTLILSFHLRLGLPSGLFRSGFPTKTLYSLKINCFKRNCNIRLHSLCHEYPEPLSRASVYAGHSAPVFRRLTAQDLTRKAKIGE